MAPCLRANMFICVTRQDVLLRQAQFHLGRNSSGICRGILLAQETSGGVDVAALCNK